MSYVFASEFLQEAVPLDVPKLACYLITQSNVIAAVDRGTETLADAEHWLLSELTTLFKREPRIPEEGSCNFTFGGYVSLLRAAA